MNDRSGCGDDIARVSRRAVVRAAGVASAGRADAEALCRLLYAAGSVPAGVRWRRVWSADWVTYAAHDAAEHVVGLDDGYTMHSTAHWHSWIRRDVDPAARQALRHKVYVSPQPEHHAMTLRRVLRTAFALEVLAWKTGADTHGVLRPDSIMLYCGDAESAGALAAALVTDLAATPGRGVPFTGQVGRTGLVSRAVDPLGTSWRAHVVHLLAAAVQRAAQEPSGLPHEPASAEGVAAEALDALERSGLDVRTWQPHEPVASGCAA